MARNGDWWYRGDREPGGDSQEITHGGRKLSPAEPGRVDPVEPVGGRSPGG